MSDQLTSQSRSNESGITRRTALRGAAWSASAVTVVVAVPAYAATSGKSGAASGTISRDSKKKVTPSVVFTNTSAIAYPLVVSITYKNGSHTALSSVAAGGTVNFQDSFQLQTGGDDQTVTMEYFHDYVDAKNKLGTLTFKDVDTNENLIVGAWT